MLEGLVIHKAVYKERDLICKILTRSGTVASVYFYGGRGGGRFSKGTILELGFMLKINLQLNRKKNDPDILIAKDWDLIWNSDTIRNNVKAFYFSHFIFELISKVAQKHSKDSINNDEGLFKITSNSLFFLDDALKRETYIPTRHIGMFLIKAALELGVIPDLESCLYCFEPLEKFSSILFEPQNGGFCCNQCNNLISKAEGESSKNFLKNTQAILSTSFKSWDTVQDPQRGGCEAIFKFLCTQFEWQPSKFISYSMLY